MKQLIIPIERDAFSEYFCGEIANESFSLCQCELVEFFDISYQRRKAELVLSDRPLPESYFVKPHKEDWSARIHIPGSGEWGWQVNMTYSGWNAVRKAARRVGYRSGVYVQLRY